MLVFNATISLSILCLEDRSIVDSGVLNSPIMIMLLSIFFLKTSKIFFFFKDFIYLFLEIEEGRERNVNVWLSPMHPLLGT